MRQDEGKSCMFSPDWKGWLQLRSGHHEMPTKMYALIFLMIKSVTFGTL